MLKAIKIKLYPDNEQKAYLNNMLGSCRFVYNNLLAYKVEEYTTNKKNVTFGELGKKLVDLKTEYEWLKLSHSKVLQQSIINMLDAYKNFFINGNGFPKFKSRKASKQTCRFPSDAISKINGNRITITKKLNDIHFKCSIRDEKYLNKNQKNIKSGTLTKSKSGVYTFSILVDTQENNTLLNRNLLNSKPINDIVGIDLGIKDFIITSEGESFENIKTIRNNAKKIARLQRRLSKKVKGSNNKNKARIKLAKYHEKLNNKKDNYLHQVANQLLNENQVIVMEDLNVSGMMKNHNLARSIQELSLFRFKTILKYKAEWYGRDIIEIDRWFPSSKQCSNCKHKNKDLTLQQREWTCSQCNTKHDRDLNAAINIRNEGLKILGFKNSKEITKPLVEIKDGLEVSIGSSSPDYKPMEIMLDSDLSLR